jgi:hypothetical protein
VLRLALLVAFPVVGLEQVLHSSPAAILALPAYEALHWLSDGLLALPLAAAAVWLGGCLARRFALGRSLSDLFARACVIALLFALLLVPGAALHEQADRLTHAHVTLSIHSHGSANVRAPANPLGESAAAAIHALADGLEGQVIGLPLAFVALVWSSRRYRREAAASARRGN